MNLFRMNSSWLDSWLWSQDITHLCSHIHRAVERYECQSSYRRTYWQGIGFNQYKDDKALFFSICFKCHDHIQKSTLRPSCFVVLRGHFLRPLPEMIWSTKHQMSFFNENLSQRSLGASCCAPYWDLSASPQPLPRVLSHTGNNTETHQGDSLTLPGSPFPCSLCLCFTQAYINCVESYISVHKMQQTLWLIRSLAIRYGSIKGLI